METKLIGTSPAVQRIKELISHVAEAELNTIITGESGVGKEVVARCLYENSARKGNPFVKVNCAALPDGLFESELFGFEVGAFTGAEKKRRGKFELAHNGVLMLDEIGELKPPLQCKLLHALQSGEFAPLGSEKEVKTDIWIIAATNRNLEQCVKEGAFREDLYYRLNIVKIHIPPLRKRGEDIPALVNFYVKKYSAKMKNADFRKPDNRMLERMMQYSWPGNVRELQNFLKRFLLVNDWDQFGDELENDDSGSSGSDLPVNNPSGYKFIEEFLNENGEQVDQPLKPFSLKKIKKMAMDRVEKAVLEHVLEKTGWNRTKAVNILDISYKTLLYKIDHLNLKAPETKK